jgi:hypothetical protein
VRLEDGRILSDERLVRSRHAEPMLEPAH